MKVKTLYIIDFFASCNSKSCQTSIRLSICKELHYDNTQNSPGPRTELSGTNDAADKQNFEENI